MLNLNIPILVFGILQSGLLCFALLRRRPKHPANVFLILFLTVVAFQLAFKLISKAWLWEHARTIYMISYNYGYLIGPLVYLFFRTQLDNRAFRRIDWLHFLPFTIGTVQTIADEVFGVLYVSPLSFLLPWPSLHIISMIGYGIAACKLSVDQKIAMRRFVVAVIVVESVIMLTTLYLIHNIDGHPDLRIVFTLLTTLVYWLTYRAIVAPEEFYIPQEAVVANLVASFTTKYANSGLRDNDCRSILSSLKMAIEKDHLFLQADISLDDVAKKLSVKKHHLSQAINQEYGHTFTELVYSWRLDEASRRIRDSAYSDQKISAIAFDLGFRSVSSFTTMFKRKFGVTPSVYRESCYLLNSKCKAKGQAG